MTNKMPVVGKRYKSLVDGKILKITRIEGDIFFSTDEGSNIARGAPVRFLDYFEELPEDNSQETDGEVSEVERAKAELAEMKNCLLPHTMNDLINHVRKLESKAELLLNALEAEKASNKIEVTFQTPNQPELGRESPTWSDMSKPEPKIDIKEERVEPVSIWKDVSELRVEAACHPIIARTKEDKIANLYDFNLDRSEWVSLSSDKDPSPTSYRIHDYCTLTDFINSSEQMQKELRRAEAESSYLYGLIRGMQKDIQKLTEANNVK